MSDVADVVLGKPLPTRAERGERVGALGGIAALGLDALASAAYGPEAALAALAPVGATAPHLLPSVMAPIVGLLLALGFSHAQPIAGYPAALLIEGGPA